MGYWSNLPRWCKDEACQSVRADEEGGEGRGRGVELYEGLLLLLRC